MGRRRHDEIDYLCERWAKVRRELLGLSDPIRASAYLGAVRSTFADVRDHRGGGVAPTTSTQFYPEVYTGDNAAVNRVFHSLPLSLQAIMDLHYAAQEPSDRSERARAVGLRPTDYWTQVDRLKSRLGECFGLDSVRTLSRAERSKIKALT